VPNRVDVIGGRELRKALKELEGDDAWKGELRQGGLEVAQIVATEAQRTASAGATTISGKHASMGSRAIATIRPLAGQTRATVALGKASAPEAAGWEWGSGGAYRQFPRKKKDGYNLYPALERKRAEVIEAYGKVIDRVTRPRFPG
jgi:hypothetical protein